MMTNLFPLVMSAWGSLLAEFNLSVWEVDRHEVVVRGNGFALIVWLIPQNGLSVYYLDLNDVYDWSTIDISQYLAQKRKWLRNAQTLPDNESKTDHIVLDESETTRILLSYARNFRELATDILMGKKDWMAGVSSPRFTLSRHQAKNVAAALLRPLCR